MVSRIAIFVLLVGIAFLALPALRHLREPSSPPPPPSRLSFSAPSPQVELGSGEEPLDLAFSPDESEIVYVATSDGVPRLWRRRLDSDDAAPLAGTEGAQQPAWKQTGRVISFFATGKLKQISLDDGAVRELADAPAPAGATWQSDGSLLFASGSQGPLRRLRDGKLASATELRPGDRRHMFPATLGGAGFIYVATRVDGRRTVRVVSDGRERDLTTTSGHAQLVGDVLVHVRDGTLLAQRFDAESATLVGRGVPLGLNVGVSATGRALMTASPRHLFYAASAPVPRELAWFDTGGRRIGTSGEPGDYWQIRISPDDRDIAATMVDSLLRGLDVFIVPVEGAGGPSRLTLALAADTDPVWAPDGRRVLFRSFQDGQANLYTRRIGVRGAPDEPLFRSDRDQTPTDWWAQSPRSARIMFSELSANGNSDVLVLDMRTQSRSAVATTAFNETDARWSPDHQWFSYVSDESGRPDVYASRWPNGGRVRVSFAGGTRPRWAPDGRALFFLRDNQLMRAVRRDATFEPARQVFVGRGLRDFDVAHRSNKLLLLLPVESGDRAEVRAIVDWQSLVSGRGTDQ